MNWRTLLPLLVLPALVACFEKDDEDDDGDDCEDSGCEDDAGDDGSGFGGGDEGGGDEGGGDGGGGMDVSVSWGGSSVDISVGTGSCWYFGMAETSGCSDCWTGEDCLYGYELGNGSVLGPYCHDIGSGDSLNYGGNPNDLQPGTTVFSASAEGNVTYVLIDGATEECFTWGDAPAYYSDFCAEL